MTKKIVITEKLRKELRIRIMELTPGHRWHVIARDERESVELAYLRIDNVHDVAEVFSDDYVTSQIYERSVGRQLIAQRTIEWLDEHEFWTGTKLHELEEGVWLDGRET